MIDGLEHGYRAQLEAWLAALGLDDPGPTLIGRPTAPARRTPGMSVVPGLRILPRSIVEVRPSRRHQVSLHSSWFGSAREYETADYSLLRSLWRRFRRGDAYGDRPTTYREPAGGFGRIDGQPVRVRGTEDWLSAQERPTILLPRWQPIVWIDGRYGQARVFWRSRSNWLHYKAKITIRTGAAVSQMSLPDAAGRFVVRPQARLRFGRRERAVPTAALQFAEEVAARAGQIYPYSAWAVAAFGDADPTWWDQRAAITSWKEFDSMVQK